MGCPGQARTKPRRSQPSQRRRRHRRTATAANKSRAAATRAAPHCVAPSNCATCRAWAAAQPFGQHATIVRPARDLRMAIARPARDGVVRAIARARRMAPGSDQFHEKTGTSNDIIGYPRMRASGESSTTKHRLLHASGPHPIPPPNDPKTNQYNQDLGLFHSTNGNHLESLNEGSSIDHQVTIHLHAQNITMFPTIETWYFTSQMLVSNSGGLILILTAQSTRNVFRIHSNF
ncbi:hypothetical protein F511_24183 [Dorcoceras hygrometricum]|uniref:Uncharacterized protein n=1 Tax=Dorcoceras hygrometricum TaxID=472368 RepID=A0A2Z7BE34_9LAMI|nr:hypothetical protein F511_24183 [Dorcoceras hygrometricum]